MHFLDTAAENFGTVPFAQLSLTVWLLMLRIALVRAGARLRGLTREIGLAHAAMLDP